MTGQLAGVPPVRGTKLLRLLNQQEGFDCPGCAWPEPQQDAGEHRKPAEFCENGAKAVAEEATQRRVTREFFAQHSVDELATKTDYWLGQQGRLVEPMVLRPGTQHPGTNHPRMLSGGSMNVYAGDHRLGVTAG